MDNYPSQNLINHIAEQAQKQAAQTELQTQIISALQIQPSVEITCVPSKQSEIAPSTIQKWDRRACTSTAFYSLIDPEDWVMAFGEMVPGLEPRYGLKISSLEKRITYWNYNKEDKSSSVSRLLEETCKAESPALIDDYTLERLKDDFWEAALESFQKINEDPEAAENLFLTASVQAIAEAICERDGWMDKEIGAEQFCKSILIQFMEAHSQAVEFFESLSWLSRSLLYDTKDREPIDSLDYEGVIQGIFEATHSMCSAYGGYDLSLNSFLKDVDTVIYLSKSTSERLRTLDGIRTVYRSNWKVIRDRIQEEMDGPDYIRLQSWVADCRQQIEQAIKHQEKCSLRAICGQQQFIFNQTNNPSYRHAAIGLFIDILDHDLKGLEVKHAPKLEAKPKPDSQRAIVIDCQQEEEQKRQIIRQIAEKERVAGETYATAITINARRICDLRTQNDWRFEAWRLFVPSFFIREEGFEEFGIPLFYLCNPDEVIKQEFEATITGDHAKSPTVWMWQYHHSIEALALNSWIEDALTRLKRAMSIGSELRFAEVARPTLLDRQLPLLGSPPRSCLYGALFERLLLDPPDWIKQLPERREQTSGSQIALPLVNAIQLGQNAQSAKSVNPHSLNDQECPFDLTGFSTIEQKERFLFVWQQNPTLNEIKAKFKIERQAWNKSKEALNQKLQDCEIRYSNGRYEVTPLSVE